MVATLMGIPLVVWDSLAQWVEVWSFQNCKVCSKLVDGISFVRFSFSKLHLILNRGEEEHLMLTLD